MFEPLVGDSVDVHLPHPTGSSRRGPHSARSARRRPERGAGDPPLPRALAGVREPQRTPIPPRTRERPGGRVPRATFTARGPRAIRIGVPNLSPLPRSLPCASRAARTYDEDRPAELSRAPGRAAVRPACSEGSCSWRPRRPAATPAPSSPIRTTGSGRASTCGRSTRRSPIRRTTTGTSSGSSWGGSSSTTRSLRGRRTFPAASATTRASTSPTGCRWVSGRAGAVRAPAAPRAPRRSPARSSRGSPATRRRS